MQAVMNSDFAISKFHFLRRLLFVHGHWSYYRLASMVLYFFYKNVAFVLIPFWFQFVAAFSGANPIDDTVLITFNLLFNSLPPLIQGILDQDLSEKTLMRKFRLYQQGVRCEIYRAKMFWFYWLGGAYHSLVCFFVPYGVYYGSNIDYRTLGWVCTTAVLISNLISQGIEYKTWTWIHWLLVSLSFIVYILFTVIYCAVKATITAVIPSSYGIFYEQSERGFKNFVSFDEIYSKFFKPFYLALVRFGYP